MNSCIDCKIEFEPSGDLWLRCKTCDRLREVQVNETLERVLSVAQMAPDLQDMKPEIVEAQSRCLKVIYGSL